MPKQSVEMVARQLEEAWQSRKPLPPLGESGLVTTPEESYAVSTRWTQLRLEQGDRIVGRKIGLTSLAMQKSLGVGEPDYGALWASRWFDAPGGEAVVPADLFLQPRIEGEIAFLLGRRLEGPGVTLQDVLAATDALAVSLEIVDSRIADWRIKLVDTVADNASYGGFLVGPWNRELRSEDLRKIGMLMHVGGRPVVEAVGAAALGHPAAAVAWLANKMAQFGVALEAGDIILSGALGAAVPVAVGDVCTVVLGNLPALRVCFS